MKRPINPGRIGMDPSFFERMAIGERPVCPKSFRLVLVRVVSVWPASDAMKILFRAWLHRISPLLLAEGPTLLARLGVPARKLYAGTPSRRTPVSLNRLPGVWQ